MAEKIPVWNKALLVLEEAASYTGIDVNKRNALCGAKDLKVIQDLCGHSDSDVTLDIYTTVANELKQRGSGDLGEKLELQGSEWEQRLDHGKEVGGWRQGYETDRSLMV